MTLFLWISIVFAQSLFASTPTFHLRHERETCEQTLARMAILDTDVLKDWAYSQARHEVAKPDLDTFVEVRPKSSPALRELEGVARINGVMDALAEGRRAPRLDQVSGWDFILWRDKRPGHPILVSVKLAGGRMRFEGDRASAGEFILVVSTQPPAGEAIHLVEPLIRLAAASLDPSAHLRISTRADAREGGQLIAMIDTPEDPNARFRRTVALLREFMNDLRDLPRNETTAGFWKF